MSAGTTTSGAGSARSRCCGPGKTAGSGLPPPGTWTRVSVLPRAICETWCATGVCCDGSGLGVGASLVGVAAIGATSTCGTADGFACAAAHCRLPRSWDRLSRVLPRSWDHLVASNGTTRRVVPGCPRRSGSSTRVGADRRAAGPVLSADVSVLGHRPGRCRVGRRCAGAGPDVRADCPPAVSRTGRGPRKGLMGGKGDGGKHDSGTAGPDDVVGGGRGGDVDGGVLHCCKFQRIADPRTSTWPVAIAMVLAAKRHFRNPRHSCSVIASTGIEPP